MTTAKNEVFFAYKMKIINGGGGLTFGGGSTNLEGVSNGEGL